MVTRKRFIVNRVLALLATGVLLWACGSGGSDSGKLAIGRQAPNFTYLDLRGGTKQLKDLNGKVVFLRFWADWCRYCTTEMPVIDEFYRDCKDRGFIVLAVNVKQSEATARAYVQKLNLSFPVALDRKGEISAKYRVTGLPTNYVINREGVLKEMLIGVISDKKMLEDFLKPYLEN